MGKVYNEAQKRATMKYMKENLDDIKIRVKKGDKDRYKAASANLGYTSFTQFAILAIEEKINREKNKAASN